MGGAIQRRRLPTEQQHDHSIIEQRGKDACGVEALTRSHFTALRRRLKVYPPRSAQKQQGRKNSHNGVSGNLLDVLVCNNRPTNKDRPARNSSWPGALPSTKGRIHLRRLVFSPSAFPCSRTADHTYSSGTRTKVGVAPPRPLRKHAHRLYAIYQRVALHAPTTKTRVGHRSCDG